MEKKTVAFCQPAFRLTRERIHRNVGVHSNGTDDATHFSGLLYL